MTLLSQMHHPNIVKYITSFTDKPMANAGSKDKSLYIVMEVAMQKRLLPAFARKFMCARSHTDVAVHVCVMPTAHRWILDR